MSDPASVQAIEACVTAKLPGEDGQPYVVMFKTRVETPVGQSIEVMLSHAPGEGTITLDEHSAAYANMLAFMDSLRRLALSVRFMPIEERKSA